MGDCGSDYHKGLIVLVLAMFSMATGVGFIVPLLPVYAETMGASGLWIGLIFAANPFFRAILMVVFGSLADQKGKKSIIVGGLLGYMVVALGFVLATSPLHLFLLRLVQGVFSAMISPVARAYAGELSPANAEGRVMGTLNTGFFAGFAGGPLLGGALADRFGFNVPFYAMALLSGVSLLLVIMLLPEQKIDADAPRQRPIQMISDSLQLFRSDTVKGVVS
ncbi:MAG: MFS transporter, partial [Bacillota bacterium]